MQCGRTYNLIGGQADCRGETLRKRAMKGHAGYNTLSMCAFGVVAAHCAFAGDIEKTDAFRVIARYMQPAPGDTGNFRVFGKLDGYSPAISGSNVAFGSTTEERRDQLDAETRMYRLRFRVALEMRTTGTVHTNTLDLVLSLPRDMRDDILKVLDDPRCLDFLSSWVQSESPPLLCTGSSRGGGNSLENPASG